MKARTIKTILKATYCLLFAALTLYVISEWKKQGDFSCWSVAVAVFFNFAVPVLIAKVSVQTIRDIIRQG